MTGETTMADRMTWSERANEELQGREAGIGERLEYARAVDRAAGRARARVALVARGIGLDGMPLVSETDDAPAAPTGTRPNGKGKGKGSKSVPATDAPSS
jgi:hypothetical protein